MNECVSAASKFISYFFREQIQMPPCLTVAVVQGRTRRLSIEKKKKKASAQGYIACWRTDRITRTFSCTCANIHAWVARSGNIVLYSILHSIKQVINTNTCNVMRTIAKSGQDKSCCNNVLHAAPWHLKKKKDIWSATPFCTPSINYSWRPYIYYCTCATYYACGKAS